jgi:hypothetical protein
VKNMLLAVLFCASVLCTVASEVKIQPEPLREDFQIMRHALEEAHGGLYWYTSKVDMDRNFD